MRHLLLITTLALCCCRGQDEEKPTSVETEPAAQTQVAVDSSLPGPQRATAAANRVRPLLEADLRAKGLHFGDPVFLRVFKQKRQLELWIRHRENGKFQLFRRYPIAAASGKLGPKLAEGDRQVPEGFYFVTANRLKPDSSYHLALNIGYPNAYDRHHQRSGSLIMIHGNRVSIGCLAMTNLKIEEIYTLCAAALDHGQRYFRVHIFPFPLTAERLSQVAGSPWIDFWNQLKPGYDFFEAKQIPPDVQLKNGRYTYK